MWTVVSSLLFVPAAAFAWCRGRMDISLLAASIAATSTTLHFLGVTGRAESRLGRSALRVDLVVSRGAAVYTLLSSFISFDINTFFLQLACLSYVAAVYGLFLHACPWSAYNPEEADYRLWVVAVHATIHVFGACGLTISPSL